MAGFLGIDHPLIAVRDIEAMRGRYGALGFIMTPVSRHPWGTSTSVAVFRDCLLELMGLYDEDLVDLHPAGGFHFGRTVRDHLAEREGISLLALNSRDADADAQTVTGRGIACQGGIEFGRDITLPDGRPDRTSTSLRILHDPALPRLSNFICQQHRRDLIEVPRWMAHPNGATGIGQVTMMAARAAQPPVRDRLARLYGPAAVTEDADGFSVATGNGRFAIRTRDAVEAAYGPLPPDLAAEVRPCCVAVHLRVPALAGVLPFLRRSGAGFRDGGGHLVLSDPAAFGNVVLAFDAAPAA